MNCRGDTPRSTCPRAPRVNFVHRNDAGEKMALHPLRRPPMQHLLADTHEIQLNPEPSTPDHEPQPLNPEPKPPKPLNPKPRATRRRHHAHRPLRAATPCSGCWGCAGWWCAWGGVVCATSIGVSCTSWQPLSHLFLGRRRAPRRGEHWRCARNWRSRHRGAALLARSATDRVNDSEVAEQGGSEDEHRSRCVQSLSTNRASVHLAILSGKEGFRSSPARKRWKEGYLVHQRDALFRR